MFHAQPFDVSCITFKESPLGAEHAFRIQRASFFNEIESEMLSLTIKFSKFFEYRTDYVKNKQIADEFDPFCVIKQKRSIAPPSDKRQLKMSFELKKKELQNGKN